VQSAVPLLTAMACFPYKPGYLLLNSTSLAQGSGLGSEYPGDVAISSSEISGLESGICIGVAVIVSYRR